MVNTLQVMAFASIKQYTQTAQSMGGLLFCPMIDARRMEVFTALYKANLDVQMDAEAMVLDENSFAAELANNTIVFTGSGSAKAQIIQHANAIFSDVQYSAEHLPALALMAYNASNFENLAYSEPFYLKEFYKKA
jgi:tRNA threonylcarbamoyladenosine biosynthesis protein TsaB